MRIKKLFFVLIAIALTIACVMPLSTAFAGTSVSVIGSLNNKSQWSQHTDNGTNWGATSIIFDGNTAEDATNVVNSDFAKQPDAGSTYYAGIDAKFIINNFSNADGYFAFVFGIADRRSGKVGEAGTIEVYFEKGNGDNVTAGLRIIETDGSINTIQERADAFAFAEEVSVNIMIDAEKELTVSGAVSFSTTLSAFPGGRAAFGQKGVKTAIIIKELSVNKYEYQTPKNVDYLETFEPAHHPNGEVGYNANVFYSESAAGNLAPTYLEVKKDEVTNNSYLHFSNTGWSYIATKYQYSNFEFNCDIYNFQNKLTYHEDGTIRTMAASKLWIAFGAANGYVGIKEHTLGANASIHIGWNGPMKSDDWSKWGNRNIMMNANGVSGAFNTNVASMGFNIFDNVNQFEDYPGEYVDGYQIPFKVHMTVIDCVVSLWFAPMYQYDAAIAAGQTAAEFWANFPTALYCDIGITPTGYFFFGGQGTSVPEDHKTGYAVNFAMDNVEIKNLDSNANKITNIGYKVNGWPQREETYYNYNDFYNDNDLLANKLSSGATSGGISLTELVIILVCAGVVVAVAAVSVVMIIKSKSAVAANDAPIVEANENVEE